MDQSHHPQQWHLRPIHEALCPICSVPHFPFCPPPHSFVRNPHSFQTPFFEPYRMPVQIPRPFTGSPNDEFYDQRQWNRPPGMDRVSYGQFPFQRHREGFPPPPCEYGNNGYLGEAERNYKRPRVEDISSSSFVQQDLNKKNSGVSSDNERLSKLIRDHGSMQIEAPEGEFNPVQRVSFGFEAEANSSCQDRSVHESVQNVIAPGNQTGSRNFGTNRMELHSLATVHADANSLSEADFGRGDGRNISSVAPAKQFLHQKINGSNYSDSADQQTTTGAISQFQRNSLTMEVHGDGNEPPLPNPMRHSMQMKHDFPFHGTQNINAHRGYYPSGGGTILENATQMEASRLFMEQPPLPASPPPPLPRGAPSHSNMESRTFSSQRKPSSLFPVSFNASMVSSSSCPPVHEVNPNTSYFHKKKLTHAATGFVMEETQSAYQTSSEQFATDGQSFALKHLSSGNPKVFDASHLFMLPHRATRPDHIVVILRGLPGSGKSYLAKMLRDLEVENGGNAPRVHSMDDYFMTEVEKIEDGDAVKSSGSVKAKKKPIVKTVMEYCYEPEMEEAYRSSMLKAFRKTLEEGDFTFVIVDDRNLRVADFAQFWAIAKSSGYEVYLLEATYRDPVGCAARNVHGFTLDSIQNMAAQWEEAPALYLRLDIKSLFHGDDLKENGIQEVDMDMGDEDDDEGFPQKKLEKTILLPVGDDADKDYRKEGEAEPDNQKEEVKELGRSKWSDDLDEDEDGIKGLKGKSTAFAGLSRDYNKNKKSVHWSDQGVNAGFSIGAVKKANASSLIIGPGVGYNLKSNPLLEDDSGTLTRTNGGLKKQSVFQQQLQAERASFKAVFDKRRQRVGLDWEEE